MRCQNSCAPQIESPRVRASTGPRRRTQSPLTSLFSLLRKFVGSWILLGTVLLLNLTLFSTRTFCQDEAKILTLDQALSIAMDQNRDIHKAEAYRQWVQGKYVEERSAALPQFTVTASGMRSHDESLRGLYGQYGDLFPVQQEIRSGQIAVSQPLYTWGQVGAAIRAARVGLATAEDQLRLYRQAARRDVSAAFYDVILAKQLHAIARENLEQRERHLEEARKRYALGTATDYDVLAAEVAAENARPEVIRADNGSRKYLVDQLDSHGKTWNAGIYFSFPLFDGLKSRGRLMQARSDLTTAAIETAKARDQIALEVRTALDAVKESGEIVTALGGTVEQARKLLEMAEKGFEYGVKTRLEVEDAQLNLSQAEGSLARAQRDYLVARVTLQWVEGILGE
jgi:outer membrane protein TolC